MATEADGVARAWVDGFLAAWLDHDLERLDAVFAPEIVFRWHPEAEPIRGLDALRSYWEAEGDLQRDLRVAIRPPLLAARTVVAEFWVQMDYAGTDASDPEAIARAQGDGAAASHAVSGQLCVLAELDDGGRCHALRQYQLGGDGDTPPPAWWTGFTATSPPWRSGPAAA